MVKIPDYSKKKIDTKPIIKKKKKPGNLCPKCGFPIMERETYCRKCGTKVKKPEYEEMTEPAN